MSRAQCSHHQDGKKAARCYSVASNHIRYMTTVNQAHVALHCSLAHCLPLSPFIHPPPIIPCTICTNLTVCLPTCIISDRTMGNISCSHYPQNSNPQLGSVSERWSPNCPLCVSGSRPLQLCVSPWSALNLTHDNLQPSINLASFFLYLPWRTYLM